jgi:hypothetical protein
MRRLLALPALLVALAATAPAASAAEVIVQFEPAPGAAERRAIVRAAGG